MTVKAGGELSFKLAPRDRFGNDASAADDAAPATFSWQLVMTKAAPRFIEPEPEEPSKKGMNEKELAAAAEAALALLPPERLVFGQAFDHLEQTSPSLIEAGEYELRVTHRPPRGGENLVRTIPNPDPNPNPNPNPSPAPDPDPNPDPDPDPNPYP